MVIILKSLAALIVGSVIVLGFVYGIGLVLNFF